MTNFLGFSSMDEYKVMGLAAYGTPTVDLSFFCKTTQDGYRTDPSYFRGRKDASHLERYYSDKLVDKLGMARLKDQPLNEHFINIASSTQETLENCGVSLVNYLHTISGKTKERKNLHRQQGFVFLGGSQ